MPKSNKCQHEPDPTSITPADSIDWIVDVRCRKCGASGAVRIDPVDVQFDGGDEEPRDDDYEQAAARARANDFEDTNGKDWT